MEIEFDRNIPPELVPERRLWVMFLNVHVKDATGRPNMRAKKWHRREFIRNKREARAWFFSPLNKLDRDAVSGLAGTSVETVAKRVMEMIRNGETVKAKRHELRRPRA